MQRGRPGGGFWRWPRAFKTRRQGKRTEAQQLLVEVYGWCTEGFDTAHLQEAKALLEVLEA